MKVSVYYSSTFSQEHFIATGETLGSCNIIEVDPKALSPELRRFLISEYSNSEPSTGSYTLRVFDEKGHPYKFRSNVIATEANVIDMINIVYLTSCDNVKQGFDAWVEKMKELNRDKLLNFSPMYLPEAAKYLNLDISEYQQRIDELRELANLERVKMAEEKAEKEALAKKEQEERGVKQAELTAFVKAFADDTNNERLRLALKHDAEWEWLFLVDFAEYSLRKLEKIEIAENAITRYEPESAFVQLDLTLEELQVLDAVREADLLPLDIDINVYEDEDGSRWFNLEVSTEENLLNEKIDLYIDCYKIKPLTTAE